MKPHGVLCTLLALLVSGAMCGIASAAFVPTDLDNLHVWYDASQGVTGTTDVTGWADQSGNGYDLSVPSGSATSPTLQSSDSALNGMASIDFDGVTDALRVAYGSTIGLSDASYFVVFVPEADSSVQMLMAHRSTGTPLVQGSFQSGLLTVQARQSGLVQTSIDGGALDVGKIGYFEVDGSGAADSVTAMLNGATSSTQSGSFAGPINSSLFTVAAYSNSTGDPLGEFNGRIAEIVFYSDPLTATEKNQVGYYLEQKYGLDTAYTPEPSTFVLLAGGLLGLLAYAWRKRRA